MNEDNSHKKQTLLPKEKIEKALAVMKKEEFSLEIPNDFSHLTCYNEQCSKKPYYTLGSLLPSVWFTEGDKRLVPVILVSCIEHRNTILDGLPEKTVSVVVRDVSKQSYKLLSEMLKHALIRKEAEFTYYYSA